MNKEKDSQNTSTPYEKAYKGSLVLFFISLIIFLLRTSYISVPEIKAGENFPGTSITPEVNKTVPEKNIINDLTVTQNIININSASAKELCSLKGIGEKTAAAIINYREKNGPFKNKEDLKKVKGIGEKKYSAIAEKIKL